MTYPAQNPVLLLRAETLADQLSKQRQMCACSLDVAIFLLLGYAVTRVYSSGNCSEVSHDLEA